MITKLHANLNSYDAGDLIITDPPYNIGYHYNGYKDKIDFEEYQSLFEPMRGHRCVIINYAEITISQIIPVLGFPLRCVAWTYPSNTGNRQWRLVSWFNCEPNFDRVRVPYKNPTDKRVMELMKKGEGRSIPDHWEINLVKNVSVEKEKEYTNQTPEKLISNIIQTTAEETDVIVDPFAGTGTTAAVAEKLGFQWRTHDTNEVALEITKNRINRISHNLFNQ